MPTQSERTQSTRNSVLDAARAIMAERRSTGIGLSDIARRAGVSTSNIAYHFGSRDGLMNEIARTMSDQIFAELEPLRGVSEFARRFLSSQLRSDAIALHLVGDELAAAGAERSRRAFAGLANELEVRGFDGDPYFVTAALLQFGRQLAFGFFDRSHIDRFMSTLDEMKR